MSESLQDKYSKNFDLAGFANLKSMNTGHLPEALEFVLERLDEKKLLTFFHNLGFEYESIVAIRPEYGKVVEEIKNEYGIIVPIPDKLAVSLIDRNSVINEWIMDDFSLLESYKIGKVGNSLFYEECILTRANDYWRAFMLSNFGQDYDKRLQTELIFEAYLGAARIKKSNKSNIGQKLYDYADRQFEKLTDIMGRFEEMPADIEQIK